MTDVDRVFRAEYGRAVAVLARVLGDLDAAEDAVQDAFAVAAEHWPSAGIPPSPAAWIIVTARRRAIDRHRRATTRETYEDDLARRRPPPGDAAPLEEGPMRDDELRLMFTCCHPALSANAQVALTLTLLGGLTVPEIARAFLVPEATMAQRLVRAKAKIRAAAIPYRVPDGAELPDRLAAVLSVVYLVFNEGHTASGSDALTRPELCHEAIRLGRLLAGLMPDEPEVLGLLALMLLVESRRTAREAGELVLLADQDRARWDRALIDEGHALVRRCLRRNEPGPYQLQAAIQAVHADAPRFEATDWRQVLALYDQLLVLQPTPVVALNRAVAVAEVDGPAAALAVVDQLDLDDHHRLHAVRAELLDRLGDTRAAAEAFGRARDGATNAAERGFLERRLRETRLGAP